MYTLTVDEISLFPRLPIAFCEIPLNFVWKACRQSTLRIHSFTFCSMSRDTFHYRGETNQMWSYAPNLTTCVRRRHFPWECTTNQIWRWQPSESPNIAKWRPPPLQFQKIIAKRTEQRLKRNQLLNTSMTYFDKLVQNFFWNYTASLELWIFPKLQTITALRIWSQPQFPYLAPGNCKYFCPPSDIPSQLQLL